MDRRSFLKQSARAAAAGIVGGPLVTGCARTREFDLLVRGGLVYDGLGGPPLVADIGINGEYIKSIGKLRNSRAAVVVDARGLAVSPGFIDVHGHTDLGLLANPRAESAVHQGITTLVSGQCGSSPFPVPEATFEDQKEYARKVYDVDWNWRDMTGFLRRLESGGVAANYATFVGQGTIRGAVVGLADRPATPEEVRRMKAQIAEHLRTGAFGLSSGLEYQPSGFARPDEIGELCRVVAGFSAVYATHMRDEGDGILESLDEAIGAARTSGAKLQISHFKVAYPRNWPKIEEALGRLDRARRDGVDIACDRYPYVAASTDLSFYFPPWAKEGKVGDFLRRLKDPALESRIRAYVAEQEIKLGAWDKVLISSVASDKNRPLQGRDVLGAARQAGQDPYTFMKNLIIEERDMVGMVTFMMSEDNLKKVLGHPLVGVGCDASAVAPYGILSRGKPHPRAYGTFPRVLGRYVRDEKIVMLEEMIKKMTSAPAARFGFSKRGVLRPGFFADVVLFDPCKIEDRATWADPHQYPAGIAYVLVNGRITVDHNGHTGALAGRVLRKEV
jgi:N-acyl-D-amino-acid deacylase